MSTSVSLPALRRWSGHLCEPALLPPRRSAGVKQRRAGFEQAQVVRRENPLSLVAALKHVDTVMAGHRGTHEVADARLETAAVTRPPLFNLRRVRPRQPFVWIHVDVCIVWVIVGT